MEITKARTEVVACTLGEPDLRERVEKIRTGMLGLITTSHETADGYRIGFAPGAIDTVREFVAFESECCSFMTFTIDDSDGPTTWLHVSGPEGTKEFVRAWLCGRIPAGVAERG